MILFTVAVGLVRILGGPGDVDRMMAAQLIGTGGIGSLLLIAAATGARGVEDVALGLALLAAFASAAFVNSGAPAEDSDAADGPMSFVDLFSIVAIGAGAFFFLAGTVGLLRFPDALSRLHALTKADNLGLGLIVLGLLPRAESPLAAFKLVAIWALVQLAGATTAQLVGRARAAQGNGRMSVLQALDIGLAFLVFAVAAWTIFARGAFAATVGYVVYGLLLSLVWIRLFAVDVALTEAAIGSGVTGVLLIGAAARLRGAETEDEKSLSGLPRLFAAVLCILVALALAWVVLLFPDEGPSLAPQSMQHLPETGLGNPVTAVLIAYRAFDTMLEKVVLVLAVVGVWSLAVDRYWGGAPGEARAERPEPTLALLAQVLAPLGILVGVHIFWVGADEPGGAFQGGAILAAMWIIVMMARLTEAPPTSAFWLRLALVAGPLVFLVAGVAGAIFAGGFFAYPPGFAKPVILFIEAFMVLSIAVTLPMLVAGPPRREPKVDGSP